MDAGTTCGAVDFVTLGTGGLTSAFGMGLGSAPGDCAREAIHASTSRSRRQDFEKGRTALFLDQVRQFAEILKLDHYAILAAFHLRKPRIAHIFAHNKFILIQASAVDELDEEMQDAIAAVDPLTVLGAHIQFYQQLARLGREQIRAANGERSKD